MKTILFLYNSSMYAMQPWLNDGRFEVVTVDYDDTDHSKAHRDSRHPRLTRLNIDLSKPASYLHVIEATDSLGLARPRLVVSFAPCTDLAVSGARHFESKRKRDPDFQHKAVRDARIAQMFACPYAVENPVSVLASKWRKPDMYWDPCDFGGYVKDEQHPEFPDIIPAEDAYKKRSCLWAGNGFVLPRPDPVEPAEQVNPGWAKLGGKSARTKYIRSLTPRGFARAVYEANKEAVWENLV
jgi:hypothetical protein